MTEHLVKILDADRMPYHGGSGQWPEPGEWREVEGKLIACENGLHVCTITQALQWLGPHIWAVEVDGDRIDHDDKVIVRRARLTHEYTTWNEQTARLFAVDCAERVAPIFRELIPDDSRIDDALDTVRRYSLGQVTEEDLYAAWAAARDAASDAAWAAARDAASDAAWAAAWAAASDAARAAANAAAWAAARDAARAAERNWQAERLRQYLDGEVTA